MRLKILRNIGKKDTLPRTSDNPASPELPFKDDGHGNAVMYVEGEVADFNEKDSEKLIKTGLGVETDDPVGVPPVVNPAFGPQPVPVTIVEAPKPHRSEPPENPPGNRPGPRTDSRGGATGGPPSSGDAPKGGK
jgi:hypothetical protein